MNVAALRHRITLEENTPVVDGIGEMVDSWATLEEVYAAIRPTTIRDEIVAGTGAIASHVVTMRYRNDLGSSDVELDRRYRLTYDGRTFDIVGAYDLDERHRFVQILCNEMAPKSPT